MTSRARRGSLIAIAALWLASLALPAVELSSGTAYSGFELLGQGWAAPRAGVFAWYANPLFVLAAILGALGRARAAGVVSGLALFLALTSFAAQPLARASGVPVPALVWGAGFYLWLAALTLLCAWAWADVARGHFPPLRD